MRSILKQTSWLVGAQFLGRIIGLFYTIFLARNLGVSDFGLYSTALAFFSVITSVGDFGFNRYIITEVVADQTKIPSLLLNISLTRAALSAVLFAVFGLFLYFLDSDKLRVSLVLLCLISSIPQAIALTLDAIFVAIKRLQFSSVSLVVLNLTTALSGVYLLMNGFQVYGAVTAFIIGQVVYLAVLVIFIRMHKLKFLLNLTFPMLKKIITQSFPYGLIGVLGLLYFKVDTLILAYLKGNFDVGIYSAGYKFLEALVFIPSSLSAALFPNTIKLIDTDPEKTYQIYLKATFLLLAVSLVIVLSYILLLPGIIRVFLPQYLQAIDIIKILSLTIPFMFMISPQGVILFSAKKFLRPLIYFSLFNLILNIGLNFYFIPKYSFYASAWVTLISDVIGFFIFFVYIRAKLLRTK